ncbi:MAG: DUF4230 domain-containing protein [Pseudomonadota bacterium]|nr:DUF4230 domain-containing protein [Pseudomonadota bacterium]
MENKVRVPLLIGAVVVALLLGMLLASAGLVDRILGGPNPKAIATSSLESMRAQNRLVPFVARYVSVTSARQSRFGFAAERTLILPGTVRYELDLAKMTQKDVQWDGGSNTLSLRLPPIEIAGPDVDLANAREYGSAGVLGAVTDARTQLDRANRAAAVADLRKQAQGEVPMRLAREAARDAVQRSFAMPLTAAGFEGVKVVARFPEEGANDPSYLDRSLTYNQAIEEARQRRAAEGQR